MNELRAKLKKEGGFTLIEMLIVVAIIAILIAISIPVINNALEKARDATDDANFRDAAALGNIILLTDDTITTETTYWYYTNTSAQGELLSTDPSGTGAPTLYKSQCRETAGSSSKTGTSKDKNIKVVIKPDDSSVTVTWDTKS